MGGRPRDAIAPSPQWGVQQIQDVRPLGAMISKVPQKAGVQQEKPEDPIASTEDYLCGDWNIKSAYLGFLSFLLISIPGTWQAIIGIKAIIADHQNH